MGSECAMRSWLVLFLLHTNPTLSPMIDPAPTDDQKFRITHRRVLRLKGWSDSVLAAAWSHVQLLRNHLSVFHAKHRVPQHSAQLRLQPRNRP